MTAIILAAGRGSRLGAVTAALPKCLLPIGGRVLLDLTLDRVARAGLDRVLVVTGFEARRVERHLRRTRPHRLHVELVHNADHDRTNNLHSLALALARVSGPFTVINGDDFFNVRILERLLDAPGAAAAAVDLTWPPAPDAMRTTIRDGAVVRLGKALPIAETTGNAIGVYRFSGSIAEALRDELSRRVAAGRVDDFYVAAIDAIATDGSIAAVSTASLTWGEIDDAADLAAAPSKLARIEAEEAVAAVTSPRRPAAQRLPSASIFPDHSHVLAPA
ncbi:MAG: phosphocholine cytidylyltransferase family protein [Acidobacteriota bacterium]